MNASEAKMKTKESLVNRVPQMEYDTIMRNIEFRVTIGNFELWEEDIPKSVILRLKSEGYSVKRDFSTGGYNIRWK